MGIGMVFVLLRPQSLSRESLIDLFSTIGAEFCPDLDLCFAIFAKYLWIISVLCFFFLSRDDERGSASNSYSR